MSGSVMPTPGHAPAPHEMLGEYYLEESLGVGATGQVFRARHAPTGREVAVKVLHRAPNGGDAAAQARLLDALLGRLRAASRVRHPHLVEVLEVGEADGAPYVVMELVGRASLRAALQRAEGPLPLPLAVDVVRQAAEGLAYAHGHGLLHAHLTPDDLLLRSADGEGGHAAGDGSAEVGRRWELVKVSDVGMVAPPGERGAPGQPLFGATLASTPLAGLPYLSPEQTRGQPVDARSDIYSLGVVLYEAVTGYPPFQVLTPNEAAFKHTKTPPTPPSALRPEVSSELEAVVLRCLAKPPEERYATMDAVREALAPFWPVTEAAPPVEVLIAPIEKPHVHPPSLPPPAPLTIALDRANLALTPGRPEVVRVAVRNVGRIVDHVHLAVEGVPEAWVKAAPAGIQLNPRDEGLLALTVLAPRSPDSRAGDYRVMVRAVSREHSTQSPAVPAAWSVLPFADPQLALDPVRNHAWRRTTYTARLWNGGNVPARYVLAAAAEEPGLTFALEPADLALLNGAEADARVTARTRLRWFGVAAETQPFTVRAEPHPESPGAAVPGAASPGLPASVTGQFVRRALLPAWLLAPLVLLLTALGWAVWRKTRPESPSVQPVAATVRPGASLLVRGRALGDSGTAYVNESPVAAAWTPDSVRIRALPGTLPTGSPLSVVLAPANGRQTLPAGTVAIEPPPPPQRHTDANRIDLNPAGLRLRVNAVREIQATARNDSGRVLTPGLQLQFTTENPAIATVAATANDRAIVRGQGPGTTRVIVSQPNVWTRSATVTVIAPDTGAVLAGPNPPGPVGHGTWSDGTFLRSEFRLPDDGVPTAGTLGPFTGTQRTATIQLRNGTAVGYANASSWAGTPAHVAPVVAVTLSGVSRLDQPAGSHIIQSAIFDARAGVGAQEQVFTLGALEYRVRLDPNTRLVRAGGRPMFQLDATKVLVRVGTARARGR